MRQVSSPLIEFTRSGHEEVEIWHFYQAIQFINNCEIAYRALCSSYLFHKITNQTYYRKGTQSIEVYTRLTGDIVATICFPSPIIDPTVSCIEKLLVVTGEMALNANRTSTVQLHESPIGTH